MLFLKSMEFNNNLFNEDYEKTIYSLKPRQARKINKPKLKKFDKSLDREFILKKTKTIKGKFKKSEINIDISNLLDTDENPDDIIVNSTNYKNNFLKNFDEKDIMIDKGMSKSAITSQGCQIVK